MNPSLGLSVVRVRCCLHPDRKNLACPARILARCWLQHAGLQGCARRCIIPMLSVGPNIRHLALAKRRMEILPNGYALAGSRNAYKLALTGATVGHRTAYLAPSTIMSCIVVFMSGKALRYMVITSLTRTTSGEPAGGSGARRSPTSATSRPRPSECISDNSIRQRFGVCIRRHRLFSFVFVWTSHKLLLTVS